MHRKIFSKRKMRNELISTILVKISKFKNYQNLLLSKIIDVIQKTFSYVELPSHWSKKLSHGRGNLSTQGRTGKTMTRCGGTQ